MFLSGSQVQIKGFSAAIVTDKRILYTGLFVVRTKSNLLAFSNTQGF
jgi:hypothetical protein